MADPAIETPPASSTVHSSDAMPSATVPAAEASGQAAVPIMHSTEEVPSATVIAPAVVSANRAQNPAEPTPAVLATETPAAQPNLAPTPTEIPKPTETSLPPLAQTPVELTPTPPLPDGILTAPAGIVSPTEYPQVPPLTTPTNEGLSAQAASQAVETESPVISSGVGVPIATEVAPTVTPASTNVARERVFAGPNTSVSPPIETPGAAAFPVTPNPQAEVPKRSLLAKLWPFGKKG